jgi:hypothetical protein
MAISAGTGAPVSRDARILCGTVGRFNLPPGDLGINRSCVEERGLQRLPFYLAVFIKTLHFFDAGFINCVLEKSESNRMN